MPVEFKTIQEKEAEIVGDVETATGQTVPTEEIAFDRLQARSIAGMSKLNDMGIVTAQRDVFLSTTEDDTILEEYANYTDTPRSPSTQAVLNVWGYGTPSAVIPGGVSGTQYVSDSGKKFYFLDDYTVPATGFIYIQLTALEPGPDSNISEGELSITAQNSDINDTLTIDSISVSGTDEETREQWRTEMQRVTKKPVIADNGSYYYRTARERPNIIAGYAYVNDPGNMELYIESDSTNGEPNANQVYDMDQYFRGNLDGVVRLQPRLEMNMPDGYTPRFAVRSSLRSNFVVTINGLSPNNTATQEAITAALDDWFATRKPYVKGTSVENTGTITVNAIGAVIQSTIESISADQYGSVSFTVSGTSYTSYPLGRGERAYATVSYT